MRKIALPLLLLFSMPAFCQTDVELDEAIVTGSRELSQATDDVPLSISTVSRDELTATFRSSALPTLTERVPGLFTTSRGVLGYGVNMGAGSLKVRGIGGMASLLVRIDGQPQYAGLMGHPIADAYQTMMTERVEMIQGPASMMYGSGAMGGVLNIVTRQAVRDTVAREVMLQGGSYGSFEGEASGLWRKGRFSGNAGVQYRLQLLNAPDRRCPILNENGECRLQKKYGPYILCDTCYFHPRTFSQINEEISLSACLSCPECARLAILHREPTAFSRFETEIDPNTEWLETSLIPDAGAQLLMENRSHLITALCEILQDRDLLFTRRLSRALDFLEILTCEEHSVIGGLGEAVCALLAEKEPCPVRRMGMQDAFGTLGGLEVGVGFRQELLNLLFFLGDFRALQHAFLSVNAQIRVSGVAQG